MDGDLPRAAGITKHFGGITALRGVDLELREGEIVFASFDGSPESVELIKQGRLVAAAIQQPVLMGRISMEVGLAHPRGEEVEQETEVPTILVTPENVDELEATLADTVFPAPDDATPAPEAILVWARRTGAPRSRFLYMFQDAASEDFD